MLTCRELRDDLAKYVQRFLDGYVEDQVCVLTLPWVDDLGEPLRAVVSQDVSTVLVDDAGAIFFASGRIGLSSEHQQRSLEQFIAHFLSVHGLKWNRDDRVAEMELDPDRVTAGLLYFAQTIGACIATLPVVAQQEEDTETRSLGPRLATRIYRQFEAWVKEYPAARNRDLLRRIRRRYPIEGRANPKWTVDLFYEPILRIPDLPKEPPVVLVTLDLQVKEPLFKAEHAVTMSRDIVLTGHPYTVRLAFAGDGRNGDSSIAKKLIETLSQNTYQYYDLDDAETRQRFSRMLRSEVIGEPWL